MSTTNTQHAGTTRKIVLTAYIVGMALDILSTLAGSFVPGGTTEVDPIAARAFNAFGEWTIFIPAIVGVVLALGAWRVADRFGWRVLGVTVGYALLLLGLLHGYQGVANLIGYLAAF